MGDNKQNIMWDYLGKGLQGQTFKATFLLYLFALVVLILGIVLITRLLDTSLNIPILEDAQHIRIVAPANGSLVEARSIVEGTVSDLSARVLVVVHPLEASNYWVQQAPTIRKDGSWRLLVYFGRPESIDAGKQFEVFGVVNPKESIQEGQVLSQLPEAQSRSTPITVWRK